jgi:beta-galactosidase
MAPSRFSYDDRHFLLDGKPFQIFCGELHFMRIPRDYWQDRLRKARAMGLNTVCAYLFWNAHEPRSGEFVFEGQADAAEFVRIAQAEGLQVVLRPGPYVCAEWDAGGIPPWLFAEPDIRLRCSDPRFVSAAKRYLSRVGEELAPLTVNRGGPILMVQVENEYGAYGNDAAYMEAMRESIVAAGFDDVPLFTCDWPRGASRSRISAPRRPRDSKPYGNSNPRARSCAGNSGAGGSTNGASPATAVTRLPLQKIYAG